MMRKIHHICYIIFAGFFISCGEENVNAVHQNYYDIAAFFKNESAAMQKNNMKTEKVIVKDGIKDARSFTNVDWQKELKPFADCDINKPAWINAYNVDSIPSAGNRMQIIYSAKEEKMPLRRIEINSMNDSVQMITIHKERHNFYYQSDDHYTYHSGKGYEINGSQKVHFLDKTVYEIKSTFIQ